MIHYRLLLIIVSINSNRFHSYKLKEKTFQKWGSLFSIRKRKLDLEIFLDKWLLIDILIVKFTYTCQVDVHCAQ